MSGKGLGQKLMTALMDAARSKGLKVMTGEILNDNDRMIKLASWQAASGSPSSTARKTAALSW
ncbi:MAG: GNAT family N-acetyltransferase [Deltaproteobacteria bacterium]|nr:GNAT family N-acetyltransferase [Deltaproteobacteria bacterium]